MNESRRILATKISYISNIMVFYGYIHEWAELLDALQIDAQIIIVILFKCNQDNGFFF